MLLLLAMIDAAGLRLSIVPVCHRGERKDTSTALSYFQAYLIGTVNTIQSIQCSKTQAWATKWNANEKVQNTPFGRPSKGKEVLLCKADKVMVRLSIVKIDVFLFFLNFIYIFIYILSNSIAPFPLYRQIILGHRLKMFVVVSLRSAGRWLL